MASLLLAFEDLFALAANLLPVSGPIAVTPRGEVEGGPGGRVARGCVGLLNLQANLQVSHDAVKTKQNCNLQISHSAVKTKQNCNL